MKNSTKSIVLQIKLFINDLTYKSRNHIDPLKRIITNTTRKLVLGFSMKTSAEHLNNGQKRRKTTFLFVCYVFHKLQTL